MNWKTLLSSRRSGQRTKSEGLSRSAFEQDYDRIIFSHPFRRLQDKTQVHPLPENDFVHTRLTHSLEVSSVGRSLGRKSGEVIVQRHPELNEDFSLFDFGAVVAAAALAHDLGNPPFGHAGEDSLSDFFLHHEYGQSFKEKVTEAQWAELIKFEGNAQGFRIINSKQYGLRLTEATLGAFTKYPCPALFPARNKTRKSQKKYGFFQSENNVFAETAEHLGFLKIADGVWCRHPLAFLVEAADDICYSIIDLEDGCRLGLVPFKDTVELLAAVIKESFDPQKLERISGQNEKVAVLRALAINKLVDECSEIFLSHEKEILNGSFDQALIDQTGSRGAVSEIVNISVEKIYRSRNVVEIEAAGHEVLPGLLHEFIKAGEHLLEKSSSRKYANLSLLLPIEITRELENPITFYEMLRSIIDFVSGMTDKNAISMHRKIKGVE